MCAAMSNVWILHTTGVTAQACAMYGGIGYGWTHMCDATKCMSVPQGTGMHIA